MRRVRTSQGTHPAVGLLILGLLIFAVIEAAAGHTRTDRGEVLDKYVSSTRNCDEDGVCTTDTDYVVLFDCGGRVHRKELTWWSWSRYRPGQALTITHRDGRWTGIHYYHGLEIEAEGW